MGKNVDYRITAAEKICGLIVKMCEEAEKDIEECRLPDIESTSLCNYGYISMLAESLSKLLEKFDEFTV